MRSRPTCAGCSASCAGRAWRIAEILVEIESHLLDGVEQGLAQGLPLADAERLALDRFGTVPVVTTCF